jgi:hypothetical protein
MAFVTCVIGVMTREERVARGPGGGVDRIIRTHLWPDESCCRDGL